MSNDAVVSEIDIFASPERVWEALTNPAQLFTWWGKEPSVELTSFEMDAHPNGKWRFECFPVRGTNHGEVGEQLKRNRSEKFIAHGEILEYVPPKLLVWSWIANWHEHPQHPTVVRWELKQIPTGTRVRVTHSGLAQEPIAHKDYSKGWDGVLALLRDYIAG